MTGLAGGQGGRFLPPPPPHWAITAITVLIGRVPIFLLFPTIMSTYINNNNDDDIATFINTVPPPPYPGNEPAPHVYDLTPTPQLQNRPRLPEIRNTHLTHCESLICPSSLHD